ncbi:MAG TPA: sialidase family protein, partial [Terriglobales bacterium]
VIKESKVAVRSSKTKTRKSPAKTTTKLTRATLSARVNDIDITPSRWFVATTSGLYSSRDHARTWEQMEVPQMSDVISVASRADTYLVASRSAIAVSSDAGVTWQHPRLPNVTNIVSVAIAPDDSLWAAGREGAFRSTDGGQTWTYLWSLPLTQIAHLSWNDGLNRMLATGVDSTDLYQSGDGKTWTKVPAGWLLRDVTSTNGRVIAATAFDGVVLQPSSMVSQDNAPQPASSKPQLASRR